MKNFDFILTKRTARAKEAMRFYYAGNFEWKDSSIEIYLEPLWKYMFDSDTCFKTTTNKHISKEEKLIKGVCGTIWHEYMHKVITVSIDRFSEKDIVAAEKEEEIIDSIVKL